MFLNYLFYAYKLKTNSLWSTVFFFHFLLSIKQSLHNGKVKKEFKEKESFTFVNELVKPFPPLRRSAVWAYMQQRADWQEKTDRRKRE